MTHEQTSILGLALPNLYEGDVVTSGVWTPVFAFATLGDLSVVYTAQEGKWMRVGNLVFIQGRIAFTPTYTTASGTARITGLPYIGDPTLDAVLNLQATVSLVSVNAPFSYIDNNEQFLRLAQATATTGVRGTLGVTQFVTASARDLRFSGIYRTV